VLRWRDQDGDATFIPVPAGTAGNIEGLDRVIMGLRPDDLRVRPANATNGADVTLAGIVIIAEPLGVTTQVTVAARGRELVGMADGHFLPPAGAEVSLGVDPAAIHLFSVDGRRAGTKEPAG